MRKVITAFQILILKEAVGRIGRNITLWSSLVVNKMSLSLGAIWTTQLVLALEEMVLIPPSPF